MTTVIPFALSIFVLLVVVVITHVEAAIEITVSPKQEARVVANPVVTVPKNKPMQLEKPRTRSIPGAEKIKTGLKNLIVSGYRDNVFVHGELKNIPGGKIEGYLYSGNQSTYVYGELRKKEQIIQAYDAEGQLYLLKIVKK